MKTKSAILMIVLVLIITLNGVSMAASLSDTYIWNDTIVYYHTDDQSIAVTGIWYETDAFETGILEIPNEINGCPVVRIDPGTLGGVSEVVQVTIPFSVKSIGDLSFYSLENLNEVIIAEGVEEIGEAFCQCSRLTHVTLPSTITSISNEAFSSVDSLFYVTVKKGSYAEQYAKEKGIPFVYDKGNAKGVELHVGNTVQFGENGGVPMEWYVLKVESDEAMLISKDILGTTYFGSDNAMWYSCNVRDAVNDTLLHQVFNGQEANLISARRIYDPASPYSLLGVPGLSSFSRMFLLSYYEARDLFPGDELRAASGEWWLRTVNDTDEAHYVDVEGTLSLARDKALIKGIRPALWIRTENASGLVTIVDESVWMFPQESEEEDDGIFNEGDTMLFGSYEQDGDESNGKEPLEWKVLDVDERSALLITKYCIDAQPYHSSKTAVNWGESDLRNWLNNEFLYAAFTDEERGQLVQEVVTNFDTDAAANSLQYSSMLAPVVSSDFVWLLDDSEVRQYMPELEDKLAYVTKYASSHVEKNVENYGYWMLRTDKNEGKVDIVIPYRGIYKVAADRSNEGIRPVIRVDLVKLGIVEAPPEEDIGDGDWGRPYAQIQSTGNGSPENGWEVDSALIDKVLLVSDNVGGWFRMTAPEDGDYVFAVLASDLRDDLFSIEMYVNGAHRESLTYMESDRIQMAVVSGIQEGDVLTWWDNRGNGKTLQDFFLLKITLDAGDLDADASLGDRALTGVAEGAIVEGGKAIAIEWAAVPGADHYDVGLSEGWDDPVWLWGTEAWEGEPLEAEIPADRLRQGELMLQLSAWSMYGTGSAEEIFRKEIRFTVEGGATMVPEGLEYELQPDGTVIITDVTGTGDIVIPRQIDGCEVTAIADDAGSRNVELRGLTIPDTVRSIGARAFSECSALVWVEMREGLVSIGDSAFSNDSMLSELSFPSSVTYLGDYVGSNCEWLLYAFLPDKLQHMGEGIFSDCAYLQEASIPEGITEISGSAFYGCTAMRSLELPSTLTRIGALAFGGCETLTYVQIPSGVTSIGDWAFCYCTNLRSLELPSDVELGEGSFDGCPL